MKKGIKKKNRFGSETGKVNLAKAFRGELVEQDPNDESAQELLKRLKNAR